jgi:hypothetical protein
VSRNSAAVLEHENAPGAGAVGAFACAVTFSGGGRGALLSAVATQGMGRETVLDLVWFFGVYYVVAFGIGAALGFAFPRGTGCQRLSPP